MIKEKLENLWAWIRVILLLSIIPALIAGFAGCSYYWTKSCEANLLCSL